ncbi:hypothetical protein [Psychrobacter sp. UBA3068]|uniref:hypothetical protein n=1 Tax=Psychrobacter sp. UBA3068 TaxID=1947349 RepID=UPI00257F44C9|nr:hypothetical protein [Psychrobacter sp. UBA3068]
MTYMAPDLSLDVVLPQQTEPLSELDVVLCAPIDDMSITIDSTITVSSDISLSVTGGESNGYTPPPLSAEIVLVEDIFGASSQIRDVVLCRPQSEIDKDVFVGLDGVVTVGGGIELSSNTPEPRYVTLDSTIVVQPELSLNVTAFVVGISIDTYADINVQSEIIGHYDPNVFRGAMLDKSSNIQHSKLQGMDRSGGFESNKLTAVSASDDRESAKLLTTDSQSQFEANIKLSTDAQLLSESAKRVSTDSKQLYESQNFVDTKSQLKTETAKKASHSNWYSFEAMLARQTERKMQGEYSYLDAIIRSQGFELSKLAGYQYRNLIDTAKLPSWVVGYLPPPLWQTVILKEQLTAPTLTLDVVLCAPKSQSPRTKLSIHEIDVDVYGYLILTAKESDGAEPQPQTGVIFVTNSVSLTRSDDGREIKLLGFSVGIDSNSYTWSFSATVPLSELSKVDTAREPQIGVDFVCNGNLWRFILDGCEDSIQFGESSLTIKGKSRAMLLASPYSSQRGFKYDTAMSARQIAEDELNRGGVPSGFTLDWQLAGVNGWNVPANTYSYSNKTPINSLQWIAEAAGGFINAHMSEDIIHVLANYPVPSWEWSDQTPLLTLPMSLITSRSRGRVNKPAYNGVTLYGENDNGIGALVKRTGTSGGYQPPMVTSDLMTDQVAAISRGKAILSDTGDIGNIGISMPLIADIGVLKPSTLIGVNDGESWIGMVRGTTITGRLSSNRALEIDQSIDVERHFDKEIV